MGVAVFTKDKPILDRLIAAVAAPYLARIAELEAENKALRKASQGVVDEYGKANCVELPSSAHSAVLDLMVALKGPIL